MLNYLSNAPLGNIRAENDHVMLDQVFYETPDYRSLLEEHSRRIVVGRRGTGKSAIFYKIQQHWASEAKTQTIVLAPNETEVIGFRPAVTLFGAKPSYLRAACSLAWQYAILQEILSQLSDSSYKVRSDHELRHLTDQTRIWRKGGDSITSRLLHALNSKIDKNATAEERIAKLANSLGLNELIDITEKALDRTKISLHIIADRLDEGYEPDMTGIAILSGLVYAFDKLSSALSNTATTVFLRDNIFRSIQINDPDYSRNIEGDVLRLHWDEYHLFNMICNRLRTVFAITQESNLRTWNRVTASTLQGKVGFRECLRLTLYRPRDLLSLLNSAFNNARSHERDTIVKEDIEVSAREISCSRFDDLRKEYREVIPGIDLLLEIFASGKPVLSLDELEEILDHLPPPDHLQPAEGQTLAILKSPQDVVHTLYSLGFLGVWRPPTGFVFCHDGKAPDFSVDKLSKILVHPCYWIALNLKEQHLETRELEEIHDEYDIEVRSETPEIRKRKLGQFIGELNAIAEGDVDAGRFEEWCLHSIQILFATGLVNVELHPNKNLTQRRDIVGRNTGNTETWRRVIEDYKARQVVFEVKNYSTDLGPAEYRQMLSYLSNEHGKIGFIINRSKESNLQKDRELTWVREMYHEHDGVVIVKLPASLLVNWLSKLRSPQKHDAPDRGLGALLDTYERMYLRLGGTTTSKRKVSTVKAPAEGKLRRGNKVSEIH